MTVDVKEPVIYSGFLFFTAAQRGRCFAPRAARQERRGVPEETWDFAYGQKYTWETEMEIIEALKPGYVKGLTLLGGEPFEPANQRELVYLLRRINNEMPKKTIWCYTGYTLETDLLKESRARCAVTDEMLSRIDVLVDGEFVQAKKDITLRFRGSSNQRIIDLKATLAEGRTVLYKFPDE